MLVVLLLVVSLDSIPIPVIGTLLGGFIGEYIGDLAYMIIKGDGFQALGQKLMDDLKKLLGVGPAIAIKQSKDLTDSMKDFQKLMFLV